MLWYKDNNKEANSTINEFCSNENNLKNSSLDISICKNAYKKTNFFWLMLDGFAYNEATDFLQQNQDKIIHFKVNVDFYKQSGLKEFLQNQKIGMIHDAMLTGSFSRNILGTQIDIDNLVEQVKQANMNLTYVGRKYPMLDLTYSKNKNPYDDIQEDQFEKIFLPFINDLQKQAENQEFYKKFNKEELIQYIDQEFQKYDNKDYMFDWLNHLLITQDSQPKKFKFQQLLLITRKNLLYYTSYIDYLNHALSVEGSGTFIKKKQLTRLLGWAETNDFVFFLSSDHGKFQSGQLFRGEDDFINHGSSVDGNQGIFAVYSKELAASKIQAIQENITAYDISAIIPQFLQNVNQPLHSQGFSQFTNPNCQSIDIRGLRQKEVQALLYYEKLFGTQYMGFYDSDYYQILSKIDIDNCDQINGITELNQLLFDYRQFLENISSKIEAERKGKINYIVLTFGLIALVAFFYFVHIIIKMYNFELFNIRAYTNNILLLFLLYLDNIFMVFAELGNIQKMHYCYCYISCFCMIILVILWTNFWKNCRTFCGSCCNRINIVEKLKNCFRKQDISQDYNSYEMQDISNKQTVKEELCQKEETQTTQFSMCQMRNFLILLTIQIISLIFGTFDIYPKIIALQLHLKFLSLLYYPLLIFVINKFCLTINIGDLSSYQGKKNNLQNMTSQLLQ